MSGNFPPGFCQIFSWLSKNMKNGAEFMRPKQILWAPALIMVMLLGGLTQALAAVGEVASLDGHVSAQRGEEPPRTLEEGDDIFENDTVSTARSARVEIRFRDDTVFSLGPESSFRIDSYAYQPETEEESSFAADIIKGTFRFVTGLVAQKKPDSFKVNTAVATIGIRGTHVVGEAAATSATVILMAEEDGSVGAINVSNEYGAVDIDQAGYGTEVPDEFSPPSPPRRMRMSTIENINRSLQSIQRMNMPRPRPMH